MMQVFFSILSAFSAGMAFANTKYTGVYVGLATFCGFLTLFLLADDMKNELVKKIVEKNSQKKKKLA